MLKKVWRYDQNVKCTKLESGDLALVRQKAFKGKYKISDRWQNTPYEVIQCVGEHFLVYKVQLVGENTKTRTLHRNLLLPLALRNGSDETQQNLEEKEPNLTSSEDKIVDDDNNISTNKHTDKYERPVTRSRNKRMENAFLLKANILMSNHFNDD